MKACIVVPHYDHFDQFSRYLPDLASAGLPIIVVDDASPAESLEALKQLLQDASCDTTLICHEQNEGKGGAVISGLRAAQTAGFSYALQIDADGQHDSASVSAFIKAAGEEPGAIVCGEPVFDQSVHKGRFYARYITLWFARLETLSMQIRDAMCGFRAYPVQPMNELFDRAHFGRNMAFDCEVLVRAVWTGMPLRYLPVSVSYPADGKSHFRYFRDNVDIFWMHTRLLVGMVPRLPMLLARKFRREGSGR